MKLLFPILLLAALAIAYSPEDTSTTSSTTTIKTRAGMYEKFWESKTILALMEVMDAILATATDAVKKEMAFDHSQLPTVKPN
ncbi:hypothetical protein PRIPAC_74432 [Pristionchus pacificus]|uniref:Uncharacterized protein n=1 Tax=Pristionchus pacificus TaxID=54126 RepID=A0A2A6C1N7_PRIPA|nr:hypothetical protein PRIPAC_74432 [Pristionchus pacificus]|eukprot:PDM72018.1 hypothetical protein PRIPAC_38425 [Pristionchus pacificus]